MPGIGRTLATEKPQVVQDVRDDPNFAAKIDKDSGFKTRNLACVPMRDAQNELIGVLEVLNKADAYTSDDIVVAKRLIDAGASAVMPLGAPIGSGLGIQNQPSMRILREMISGVPLIVDAGVGTASDATIAMELGAEAVLMNTGIANAQDPVQMAEAMKHAVIAARQAYLSGRMPKKLYATASSPLEGLVR